MIRFRLLINNVSLQASKLPPVEDDDGDYSLEKLFDPDNKTSTTSQNQKKKSLIPLRPPRLLLNGATLVPGEDSNSTSVSKEDETEVKTGGNYFRLQTQTQTRRNRVKMEQKLSQKKTRDEKVSKLRKIEIVFSDNSDNEEYQDKELFGDAKTKDAEKEIEDLLNAKEEEGNKIPSKVGRGLRRKVNKLSTVLDNCLNLS